MMTTARHAGLTALAAALLVTAATAAGEVKVVPADILTMVDPTTGHAVKGVGGDGGTGWMTANGVWDGKTIRLSGARGETLSFQLIFVRTDDDAIRGIDVKLDLPGAKDVHAWRAWCIWDTPEVAVPLGRGKGGFDLPSRTPLEDAHFDRQKYPAWPAGVDLTMPRGLAAGRMKGKVVVSAKEGMKPVEIPIEVDVQPFALPARPKLIVEMNSYGDYHKFFPRKLGSYMMLQRLMRAHRCSFVEVPYGHGGYISSPYLSPKMRRPPGKDPSVNWQRFDADLAGLFDGAAFADKQPVSHFILPLCYNTPINFKWYTDDRDYYKRANTVLRRLWAKHIAERGWTRTVFQEFHNENPDMGDKVPWFLDEPRQGQDLAGHELYMGLLAPAIQAAGKGVRVHYRIDISNWQRLGKALLELGPKVQDWSVSRDPKYLTAEGAAMFTRWAKPYGGLVFAYGEVSGFNSNGRKVNWSRFDRYNRECWRYRFAGWEQWMIDMWKCKARVMPAATLVYSNAAGARDLVWPGQHFGLEEFLPSLRLKAIRESLALFDYAYLLVEAKPARRGEVDKLIMGMDLDSSADHYRVKGRLAEMAADRPL